MKGKGTPTLSQINTANTNIRRIDRLLGAKLSTQAPGQIYLSRAQYGGALRDKYGSYVYIPRG